MGNEARKNRAVDWIMLNGDSLTLTIRLDYRWAGRLGLPSFAPNATAAAAVKLRLMDFDA